jgi:hypothetical protein
LRVTVSELFWFGGRRPPSDLERLARFSPEASMIGQFRRDAG